MLAKFISGIQFLISKIVISKRKKGSALAGSRTRVYCLEGNNANRYTTNACDQNALNKILNQMIEMNKIRTIQLDFFD